MRCSYFIYILIITMYSFSCIHACGTITFHELPASPFGTGIVPKSVVYSPIVETNLFAVVANQGNSISEYLVDQTTGNFSNVTNSPFPVTYTPGEATYSPIFNGMLLMAVSDQASGNVYIYAVDPTTGAINPVPASPFLTPYASVVSIAYSPVVNNNLFFVAAGNNTPGIYMYSVDPINGDLSFLTSYLPSSSTKDFAFSPVVNGNLFLAALDSNTNTIRFFQVNTTTGALTLFETINATGIRGIAYSPEVNGNLFFSELLGNLILSFSVDVNTGDLSFVNLQSTGTNPVDVTYSPVVAGILLIAVADSTADKMALYQVNTTTGAITFLNFINGSPGTLPIGVAFSPFVHGNLFAAEVGINENLVHAYRVSLLTPLITTQSVSVRCGCAVSIQATIEGGTPPYTIIWSDGLTQTVSTNMVTRVVSPRVTMSYTITQVTDRNGCVAGPSNSVTIGVIPCAPLF